MKRYIFMQMAAVFAAFVIMSCSKKDANEQPELLSGDVMELKLSDHDGQVTKAPVWTNDEGVVFVVFGYGYNDSEFCGKAKAFLSEKYGLAENGGLVSMIVFPDDLHNRISNFRSIVDENNTLGIVLFGAPEGTHYTLASIRENHDNRPTFNIFSFFPQDDILGQEGTCNFVMDHESSSKLQEQEQVMDKDIFGILSSAIEYAAVLPAGLPSDNELHAHVQAIAGTRKVHRYVDGETGIQVRNHFVIESAE
ncbi:MAG: hypothetical protein KBS64_03825 [Treponema sp.]|nr:hypothetical protein [Candidatus Treponema equi]